mmetsp:Transcript_13373/g.37653  ORF Transcript_13373/g.37653 Transcript_13373/m.37653 type:complete len:498 (+) Transcript_13373:115-1608(+)
MGLRHTNYIDKVTAFRSFVANQLVLCSSKNILILIAIASLDNADKQMLSSSFPILEKVLGWDTSELGYFSICTNLAYALSLPMWGVLIHRNRNDVKNLQQLLASACGVWGIATIAIAIVTRASDIALASPLPTTLSTNLQVMVRCINGMALGSIIPLSQSLLAEYVPDELLGQAFGLLGVGEKLAGTLASTLIVWAGGFWHYAYYLLGLTSVAMGCATRYMNRYGTYTSYPDFKTKDESQQTIVFKNSVTDNDVESHRGDSKNEDVNMNSLRQILNKIIRLPAFICLVAQGVFGGTPWDMMSFLLLLMDWRGFTKNQIATIQITSGLSSMLGGQFGGTVGDYAARGLLFRGRDSSQGRIMLALASVVLGIPLYGLFLHATNFYWAILWINLFQLTATWAPAAAIRPICVDLTNGRSERAQIVALWIVMEKVTGALFGAPLVGYLTEKMLVNGRNETVTSQQKANALAFNLFLLSAIFWGICAFFWAVMLRTTKKMRT